MENIEKLESRLWEAADQLRANSKLTSIEYYMPVLGLIFLRHAYNRYLAVEEEIKATLPKRGGVARPITKDDFTRKSALFLPEKSRYDFLLNLPADKDKGKALVKAMEAIEAEHATLKGVLPKEYTIFENDLLTRLLKIFNDPALHTVSGDVFGRIYEYFLMKFAIEGAQDKGEFFTPVSLVQTIVNVIEPDHGVVFDPACGSGGMFVQTSHFLERTGRDVHKLVTFRGQEKTATTIRLARMNLAVHGLEGNILEGNTFYQDHHEMMDIFENFIVFDETSGKLAKIVARNHQFLGVNRAVEAVRRREERNGQLGVFWHTQGSGKSYSMVFFAEKVHRKLAGNFTFLVVTDREDLDSQIYKTFAGCGIVDNRKDKCRAASGNHLTDLLQTDKPYVFTMIQKFNKDVDPERPYTTRTDLIVISDEAHRTQYGRLALNMRNALPGANYIGFTGTPLFKEDEITKRIFGDYVSTYNFQRAVDDRATVPLYYDNRGEKLRVATADINEKLAAKLEELDLDIDQNALLEKALARDYHVFTAEKRLDTIARDFVEHYSTRWETGKAMLICLDKITTVRMFNLIQGSWREKIKAVESAIKRAPDEQEEAALRRKLEWMRETETAVVVSEEQNEVKRFRDWGLEIVPHREKIKNGFELADGKRVDIETAFKDAEHPFRIAIVCAMWLTGFDVPSLATLYLDKPLRAHTLMQAIARANRVHEGKNNGLIVDYCGVLKNLRKALATFATGRSAADELEDEISPVKPNEELVEELAEAIELVRAFLQQQGFRLDDVKEKTGFARNAAIVQAKEAINANDETRKRFEIQAREVFKKFKACFGDIEGVNRHKRDYDAVDIIYKKLQGDRQKAGIAEVLKELQAIVDEAIQPAPDQIPEDREKIYDISRIDFEKLKEEFSRTPAKNSTVQSLKDVVERRLRRMIARNPTRMDYYQRYQEIVDEYNNEKDCVTIEQTFEALLRFVEELNTEETRAIREELDEETLALFDLLLKPELSARERNRLKKVARELLALLKAEKLRIDNWQEKEATKAEVKTFIHDFLYDDETGLPADWYTPQEVEQRSEVVFNHVFQKYPAATPSIYSANLAT